MTLDELEKKITEETDKMYLPDKGGHWIAIAIIKLVNTGNKKNISTASETPRISIAFNIAYEKTAVIIPSPIAVKASAIGSFKPEPVIPKAKTRTNVGTMKRAVATVRGSAPPS